MLWQTTKRRIFAFKIIKRTHIYINFSDEKECIFFARTSVDRVERLRQLTEVQSSRGN